MGKEVDPRRAMTEEEPWAVAQYAGKGISQLKHKDALGNEIVDPDRSNPTRSRMERPLDTIRSFERAIYTVERDSFPRRSARYESTYGAQQSQRASQSYQYGDQSIRQSTYDSNDNASVYSQAIHQSRVPHNQRQQIYDNNHYGSSARNRGEVPTTADTNGSGSHNSGWSHEPYSTNPSSEASAAAQREWEQQQYAQNGRLPLGSLDKANISRQPSGANAPSAYSNGYNKASQQQSYGGHGANGQGVFTNQNQYSAPKTSAWDSQPIAAKTIPKSSGTIGKGAGDKRKSWFRRSKA